MQLEGRAAVLLVVALDLGEERLVGRLEPGLERDDRVVPALHLGGALEPVERLDRLDRVARGRGAERLADDAVEVDEHLAAEQVVDLVLACPVLAHEAGQRGALVGGVVVDVQPGVPAAALDEPVDEPLEHAALVAAVARPERLVPHLSGVVAVAVAEEELEPARGLVERVPLEVEPHVGVVGRGQEPEAALLLVVEQLVEVRAGLAPAELELGLVAHLLEALGPEPVRAAVRRSPERSRAARACRPRRRAAARPTPAASRRRARDGRQPPAERGRSSESRRSRSARTARDTSRPRARPHRESAPLEQAMEGKSNWIRMAASI